MLSLQPVSIVETQFSKAGWEKAQTRLESWQVGSRSGRSTLGGGGGSPSMLLGKCSVKRGEVVKSRESEEKELVSEEGRRGG